MLDLDAHGRCACKLLCVFYHLQLLADAQEEYDKHQKGKTLLNLVVIGKLVFTAVINLMQPSEQKELIGGCQLSPPLQKAEAMREKFVQDILFVSKLGNICTEHLVVLYSCSDLVLEHSLSQKWRILLL